MKQFKPTPALTIFSSAGKGPQTSKMADERKANRNGSWGRRSKAYRAANPICQDCGKRASQEVHHEVPLSQDNSTQNMIYGPLAALCIECHAARHV